jgi:hypothetical protein
VQLDAPTAFDRELWLLGLYNYHLERVLRPLNDPTNPAYDSSRDSRGTSVTPINTINFEVMPSGEMRLKLHKAAPAAAVGTNAMEHQQSNGPRQSPLSSPRTENDAIASSAVSALQSGHPTTLGSEPEASVSHPNIPWWLQHHQQQQQQLQRSAPPASAASLARCSPGFLAHVERGGSLVKHSRSARPKHITLTVSPAGLVSWKGKESFYLRDALEVTKGLTTKVFEKSIKELRKPPPSSRCFSIIMRTRTLDLEVELSEEHRKRAQALRRIALANKAGGGSIRGGTSVSGSSVGHVDSQEEAEERAMELERDAWVDNLRRIVEAHNNNNNNNATQASSTAATNPAASASTAPSAAASAKPTPAAASPTPVSAAPPAATTAASSLSASAFASPAEPSPRDSPVSGNDEVEVAERGPSGSVFVPLEQDDDAIPSFVLLPERSVPVPVAPSSSSQEEAHASSAISSDDVSASSAATSATESSIFNHALAAETAPLPPVALPPPDVAAAPVVGWRRSLINVPGAPSSGQQGDAPMLIHDTDSETEDDNGSSSSSSSSSSDDDSADDDGPTNEEAERKIAETYRQAQAAGASPAAAATAAAAAASSASVVPSRRRRTTHASTSSASSSSASTAAGASAGTAAKPHSAAAAADSSSDDDDDGSQQSKWETWEDVASAANAEQMAKLASGTYVAAGDAAAASAAPVAGSAAHGEDSSLASLLRMEPVSAVHVPQTSAQLASGPVHLLSAQLEQRDQHIRELQATVARLTAQNQTLQEQLQQANARAAAAAATAASRS